MGILSFAKKQFIDILQWTEGSDDLLAWRFPTADLEIQQGARLVVRETQMAVFVDQGHVADVFGPGTYTIKTVNLPVLTDLRHWDKLFESPFKSEVYFFSTRLRLNQTWGTANPLAIRDREFGAVRVRGFGVYSYRVNDASVFFRNISGTRETYAVAELEGQLRSTLITTLTTHLGESQVPFLDMAANSDALGRAVLQKARPAFAALGLGLEDFQIQNVSLPEDLQKRLDERIGMGIVGDLPRYTQFQVAQSIPAAAAAPGGAAGAGVGLGAGIAMGQAMSRGIEQASAGQAHPGTAGSICPRCQTRLDKPSKFCPECGAPQG
ncbi:MAG TPA: SPFH domain-containing protein [Candidatus Nitrosocosmicus sp.]|jgi:membrane protease subunit (stomatin/prohibitin family)|nr:SPFH domain-containing protein [Candidatus Nitrosocosmicus sp.]